MKSKEGGLEEERTRRGGEDKREEGGEHHRTTTTTTSTTSKNTTATTTTTRVVVFDIFQWFELRLSEKYGQAVYPVFHKLKSVLLLLKSIRVTVHELAVDDQHAAHHTQLGSIVHMLHSLIVGFPLIVDYNYLVGFAKANVDVMNIILTNLKSMGRYENQTLHTKTQQLKSQIKLLFVHITLLNQAIEETSPVLKRLSMLKSIVKDPLELFMANFQKLQAQNKLLDEAQIFYTKYTDSCKRYNELLQEPILTESLQQKEARDKLVLNMNSLLLPFISDLFGVRQYLSESHVPPEQHRLSSYLSSLQFPPLGAFNISPHIKSSPNDGSVHYHDTGMMIVLLCKFYDSMGGVTGGEDFATCFEAIAFHLGWGMFGIQKKKRHYLVELSREWDSAKFATIYKEYNEAMKQLHKIEIDNDFKQKTSMLKEVYNDSVHSQKIAKKYREEYQKCIEIYQKWLAVGSELQSVVHSLCLEEFNGVNVEVLIPQLYLNPKQQDT